MFLSPWIILEGGEWSRSFFKKLRTRKLDLERWKFIFWMENTHSLPPIRARYKELATTQ